MTARPFGAISDTEYNLGPHYLSDGFEDRKIHAPRDSPLDHDFVMPEHTAGQALRGHFRPDWEVVSGDVFAVTGEVSGRIGFGGGAGPHIAAVPSIATVAEWQFSAQFTDSDQTGEQWFIDLIWDPVRETGWRIRFLDTLNFRWEKHTPNGVTEVATGDWKPSWDDLRLFEEFHVSRDFDGTWMLAREWSSDSDINAAFQDPWLPQAPRQLRMGASAYGGGENRYEKQSSFVHINDPLNEDYRHERVGIGV